jgi:hypothetical protein
MRRLQGIAAILMLVLMMPLARASTILSHGAKVQPECCQHVVAVCCAGSPKVCCVAQTPADTALYPVQNISPLALPAIDVAVIYAHRLDDLKARCMASRSPAEHSPPGLIIAATIVLRI